MRRHAKPSSAGSNTGAGGSRALGRSRLVFLALCVAGLVLALGVTLAQAGKKVDRFFPIATGTGTLGGQFNTPRDIAINHSGAGAADPGDFYVADTGNNRIQRFAADGTFERAWGVNVSGRDEVQTVKVDATAGKFNLTFNGSTTADVDFNVSGANLDNALDVLASINGDANVAVSGPTTTGTVRTYTVTFTGTLGGTDVPQMTGASGAPPLSGGTASVSVATTENGTGGPAADFEVCTVAAACKNGVATGGNAGDNLSNGAMNAPQGIAVNQVTGDLYVRDRGNQRVNQYDADGNFIRSWGWDVVVAGQPGSASERQRVAVNANAGTFKLTFASQTTGDLQFNASAAGVEAALNGLSSVSGGGGSVTVTGGPGSPGAATPYFVTFNGGPLAGTDVAQMTSANGATPLSGGTGAGANLATVTTVSPGSTGFEICVAASRCKSGTSGGGAGQFFSSSVNGTGVAIAPAGAPTAGNVFVGDVGGRRVAEYDSSGHFIRAWGYNVAPAGEPGDLGTAVEVCTLVCQGGPMNTFGTVSGAHGAFETSHPAHLAVDGNGIVYASNHIQPTLADPGVNRVDRFDSSQVTIGGLVLTPILSNSPAAETAPLINQPTAAMKIAKVDPDGVGVQPAVERLFIARGTGGIQELTTGAGSISSLETHMEGSGLTPNGLDFSTSSNDLYVTSSSLGAHRVYALDDDGASAPLDVTIDPPTGIGAHTASFSGTVNPGGFPTSYRFEYSKSGAPGTWTAVAPMAALGEGTSPVDVPLAPAQGAVTGLEANTLYRVRIVGNRGFGNLDITSPELIFATHAAPPEVETVAAQQVSDTTAQLVGRVNPNNMATTYWFEYGPTTAYGTKVPAQPADAGNGGVRKLVTQDATNLLRSSTYHFRLVAASAEGTSQGPDRTFVTRSAAAPAGPQRAYEMVTPPFKATRSNSASGLPIDQNANVGYPSLDGDAMAWSTFVFPLTEDVAAPGGGDRRIIRRTAGGWEHKTMNTLPFIEGVGFAQAQRILGSSGDFRTMGWSSLKAALLPGEGTAPLLSYTRRDGTGVAGFTPWVTNASTQIIGVGLSNSVSALEERAIFNDDGSAMARWGQYRGLAELAGIPGDEDPSDNQQLPGTAGGNTAYTLRAGDPAALPAAEKDLVGECTGTTADGDATGIPARIGSGVATDTIGSQACEQGTVTSVRGSAAGGGGTSGRPAATAMSNDGHRVFFQSPDPGASGVPTLSCGVATGAATSCPPQLFVRQYDEDGDPVVRWVSRSRSNPVGGGYDGAMIAGQQVAEMTEAVFQGASRDGRNVYFKTTAPLTPDDPNAGVSVTTGSAQAASWDLYRYELPASLDADPGTGTLTRITGGPAGTGDPNANAEVPLRFLSDDGKRAYFVTKAPLAGADASPPVGGGTGPGSTSSHNLYLFDENESGADRYSFIANFAGGPSLGSVGGAACATLGGPVDRQLLYTTAQHLSQSQGNCMRGTRDGTHIVFFTTARLTADDVDDAGDLYLYDAERDELTRISAPPAGTEPFVCNKAGGQARCNATLSTGANNSNGNLAYASAGSMDFARGWGGGRYENIAKDGAGVVSVYFESRVPFVSADTNGTRYDVYQWREGRLSLISPGNSDDDAWFSGNSVDGRDVFFFTSQRIDPREIDSKDFDIYDARVGGGFPYTPPARPCDVLALQCEVNAIAGAADRSAQTPGAQSGGNVVAGSPGKCKAGQVRKKGKCVKKKPGKKARRTANQTRRAGR